MYAKTALKYLVVVALLIGILFRWINLDNKIYWVDEAATSLRISGYTKTELIQEVSAQRTIAVKELQKYQRISPEKDFQDTWVALTRSPEHAPLYFVLARLWAQQFGSAPATIRSLSVCFSLFALLCFYWLCTELFNYSLVSQVGTVLLAVSPFYVAYAQEARPYSLWTVIILLSSVTLLRAVRLHTLTSWAGYAISLTLGFYTSLLSGLVAIGHCLYVVFTQPLHNWKTIKAYGMSVTVAIVAFAPWLWVIAQNWQQLQDNTTWMRESMPFPAMVAVWLYSIVIIFVDFPVYLPVDSIILGAIISDLALLTLVGFAIKFTASKTTFQTRCFLLTLILATPLILILIDLALGKQASTAPRYLIPAHLGIYLAVAFLLTHKIYPATDDRQHRSQHQQALAWRIIAVILMAIGIASCIVNLDQSPKYQKTRNLHNLSIAAAVNQTDSPLLIAEPAAIMDLLSLSYSLKEKVEVQVIAAPNRLEPARCKDVFFLDPSAALISAAQKQFQIEQIYSPRLLIPGEISLTLWTLVSSKENCFRS
jgi:uncharacterized membrane protein